MRIGSLPPPQMLFYQLDHIGRYRKQYLYGDTWLQYAASQAAQAELLQRPDEAQARLRDLPLHLKYMATGISAVVAGAYLETSDARFFTRSLGGFSLLTDPDYIGPQTLTAYLAAGVTPWCFTGAMLSAEWTLGRPCGHGAPETFWGQVQTAGLLGYAVEYAPMALGDALSEQEHTHLAAACYWAACLGRVLLFVPRACLAALASVNALFWTGVGLVITGLLCVGALLLREQDEGIDPHGAGRPRTTQRAITDLRRAYGRQNEAAMREDAVRLTTQLPAFVTQLERDGTLPRKTPNGETWSQAVAKATLDLQRPYARFVLPLEGDVSIPAWDVAGFVWYLLEHGELENETDKAREGHARWLQKVNFVKNMVECINVCTTRQAQHLLLPLQGLVGNFCIDESRVRGRPDVGGFVQEQLSTFAQRDGTPIERLTAMRRAKEVLREARQWFNDYPQEMTKVTSDLADFLSLTYDDLGLGDLGEA